MRLCTGDVQDDEDNGPREVMGCWIDGGIKAAQTIDDALQATHQDDVNCAVEVKNIYFEWIPPSSQMLLYVNRVY